MDTVVNEKDIERRILVGCSGDGMRLFKNETGAAYRGSVTRHGGSVVINKATMVKYGLCNGSSDLIGFRTVRITEDMVGKDVAQIVALEVKAEKGRATDEQQRFIKMINDHGGLSGIVRSLEEAQKILQEKF